MTSEFVRQIHRQTCQRLAAAGAPEQTIREHLRNVWLADQEVEQLLAELGFKSQVGAVKPAEMV